MVWNLIERGRSLTFLKYFNIDAITAWRFSGLRVDSLVRSMWYNPHHSMSAALGLIAMPVAGCRGRGGAARRDRPGRARAGALHDLQSARSEGSSP